MPATHVRSVSALSPVVTRAGSTAPIGHGRRWRLAALAVLALGAGSCSSPRSHDPRIRELYRDAARHETRNPVVVIHGILGARLQERGTGRVVWGAFTGDYADPTTVDGGRLIAMPMQPPVSAMPEDQPPTAVVATGPLGALQVGFLFTIVNVDVYAGILRTLGVGGFRDPVTVDPLTPEYADDHFTCHTFFYDWRRDNIANAIELGRFLRRTRSEIERRATAKIAKLQANGTDVARAEARELEAWLARGFRFDVVAHSMGGLIAHYYLRYGEQDLPADGSVPTVTWAGCEQVDRLVMVGTPNLGAMDALAQLHGGFQVSPLLPSFHPTLLGTMPSIYQLLPRTRHGVLLDSRGEVADADLFDAELWLQNGWGLAARDADPWLARLLPDQLDPSRRRQLANDYLRWCLQRARDLHRALDQAAPPPPARLHLFAADGEPTLARCILQRRGDSLQPTFDDPRCFAPGDVTVTRASALGDERTGQPAERWLRSPLHWHGVTFLSDDHVGITTNPHFANNMLHLLLETEPRRRDE
jgi:hypothetical protein